jgi:hypothetical protein
MKNITLNDDCEQKMYRSLGATSFVSISARGKCAKIVLRFYDAPRPHFQAVCADCDVCDLIRDGDAVSSFKNSSLM